MESQKRIWLYNETFRSEECDLIIITQKVLTTFWHAKSSAFKVIHKEHMDMKVSR
jgi:hypothetical protein